MGTKGERSRLCGVPSAQASRTYGVNGRTRGLWGLGLMEGTDLLKGCWFFSPGPLSPWNNAAPRLPWLQEGRFCVKSTHLKKYIYLWLHWVFVAVQGPLPVVVSKACSVISVCSLLVVVSVVKSVGSSAHGLQ